MKMIPMRLAVALFLAHLLSGCAGLRPERAAPPPPAAIPGDPIKAIKALSSRPGAIRAKGSLRIVFRGEAQPRIKGLLSWTRTENGILLRATGLHLIGGTIFDLLATETDLYLSIPSRNTVYAARIDGFKGSILRDTGKKALRLLAPWAVAETPGAKLHPCPESEENEPGGSLICAFSPKPDGGTVAVFNPGDLSPVSLRTDEIAASYEKPTDLSGIPYPQTMEVAFDPLDLSVRIDLTEIALDAVSPTDTAFDPAPFLSAPIQPLEELLEEIRETYMGK